MNLFDIVFKKRPDLLPKYVSIGISCVGHTVVQLNKVMLHLMKVQGIDPNTQPGILLQRLFDNLTSTIPVDVDAYEKDFDFNSALKSGFDKVKGLTHLKLDVVKYKNLTDLSNLTNSNLEVVKGTSPIGDVIPISGTANPIEDLEAFVSTYGKTSFDGTEELTATNLKKALETIRGYAKLVDDSEKENVDLKRESTIIEKTKKTAKVSKKGNFRRVDK